MITFMISMNNVIGIESHNGNTPTINKLAPKKNVNNWNKKIKRYIKTQNYDIK